MIPTFNVAKKRMKQVSFSTKCIFLDIDECSESESFCDQICVNTIGGFKCDCARGYIFEPPRGCRFNGKYVCLMVISKVTGR